MSLQDSIYASTEDDFAQTRGADDLFEPEISTQSVPPPTAPTGPRGYRAPTEDHPRGYHRGGRRGGRGGRYQAPEQSTPPVPTATTTTTTAAAAPTPEAAASTDGDALRHKPQDRTLSGGLKKPKLTEDELAARMERVKLNNQRLTERRRKAEEDENKFQLQEAARKQTDAAKRVVERKKKTEQERNRKELDDEREKNRQRKLKAVGNREWDSEKKEEDYNPSPYPKYRRGAHGAVQGAVVRNSPNRNPTAPKKEVEQPKETTDWPDLPVEKPESSDWEKVLQAVENPGKTGGPSPKQEMKVEIPAVSPLIGKMSWADQVEDGSPATPSKW